MGCLPTTRIEPASYGFAPEIAGVGSDVTGSQIAGGLRVPPLATTNLAGRYLFVGASKWLGRGQCARVVGVRQLVEIGVDTNAAAPGPAAPPVYAVPKAVTTPSWHFADTGPVCFSLRYHRVQPQIPQNLTGMGSDSLHYLWPTGGAPGLVYSTIAFPPGDVDINGLTDNYTTLTAYTAPWSTMAMGLPVGQWGDIRDVRFPWDNPTKQALDPVVVRGPGMLVLWISVWQTNPTTRPVLSLPAAMPLGPGIPEEGFVYTFPNAIYWRVGGAVCIEEIDSCAPDPGEGIWGRCSSRKVA